MARRLASAVSLLAAIAAAGHGESMVPGRRSPYEAETQAARIITDGNAVVIIPSQGSNDTEKRTSIAPPMGITSVITGGLTLPAGSYHAAVPATEVCKPRALSPADETTSASAPSAPIDQSLHTKDTTSPAASGLQPSEPGSPNAGSSDAQSTADGGSAAAVTEPSPTPAGTPAPQIRVAPDGRRYKCCDNTDCSPGSPGYAGDCDTQVNCRNIVCPPYESLNWQGRCELHSTDWEVISGSSSSSSSSSSSGSSSVESGSQQHNEASVGHSSTVDDGGVAGADSTVATAQDGAAGSLPVYGSGGSDGAAPSAPPSAWQDLEECVEEAPIWGSTASVAFPEVPPATPECKTWVPEEEVCKCACRCICIYSPSGRVYWLPGEPPKVDASTLKAVEN